MKNRLLNKITAVAVCICTLLSVMIIPTFAAYENTYKVTGDGAKDIVGVAKTQLENTDGTKYCSGQWCCGFVSWCARQAGISTAVIPDTFSCNVMFNFLGTQKLTSAKGSTLPKTGDLVFFSGTASISDIDHIGIVTGVSGQTFYVIEGNYNAYDGKGYKVASTSYTLASKKVVAFAYPDYSLAGSTSLIFKIHADTTMNIRSGANASSSLVGQLYAQTTVSVSQITENNWGNIYYGGSSAWMILDYSDFVSGTFVSKNAVNLRSSASIDGTAIDVIPKNTRITITKVNKNWGYATYMGKSGWVCLTANTDNHSTANDVNWLVVDVSKWNTNLDWNKIKAAGVKAAIIRVGGTGTASGEIYNDDKFLTHYKAAKAAGLYVGAYFFSYKITAEGAKEEAQFAIDILKKNNCKLDMPLFIDIEDEADYKHTKAGKSVCTAIVNAFCDTVEAAGFYPGIYCSKSFCDDFIDSSALAGRALWIAQYGVSQCGFDGKYDMWQYTSKGEVSGSPGNIDLSRCYTDFPSLIANQNENPGQTVVTPGEKYGSHIAGNWVTVTEATCKAPGMRQKKCKDCGIVLEQEEIPVKAHTESVLCVDLVDTGITAGNPLTANLRIHKNTDSDFTKMQYESAVETQGGTKLTYCTSCNIILSAEYYYKDNTCKHSSTTAQTVKEATCTSYGVSKTVCKSCKKDVDTKLVVHTGHEDKISVYENGTCTVDGLLNKVCTTCETTVSATFVTASQHTDSGWRAVKAVTLTQDGEYTSVCSKCGSKMTKTVKHHIYGDADGDGNISTGDARLALRQSVALEKLDDAALCAMDIDASGNIEAADARLILRLSVGLENSESLYNKYYKK